MKKNLLKSLLVIVGLLCSLNIGAYDFVVDGIHYNINSDKTSVSVTFESSEVDDDDNIVYYNSISGIVNIPQSVTYNNKTYKVSSIGVGAFANSKIKAISIPNTITSIEREAFYMCNALASVILEDGTTDLSLSENFTAGNVLGDEYYGLFNCSTIFSIYIGRNLTYDEPPFWCNQHLQYATFGPKVTSIPESLFASCSSLKKISVLANTPPTLGEYSFASSALTAIYLKKNISSYKSATNWQKYSSKMVALDYTPSEDSGDWVEVDGIFYFINRGSKTASVAPGSITNNSKSYAGYIFIPSHFTYDGIDFTVNNISGNSFKNCENIIGVYVPQTINSIETYAFSGCSNLIDVQLCAGNLKFIGLRAFYDCTSLCGIIIPEGVTKIGDYCFENCTAMTSVSIPSTIGAIGVGVFNTVPWYNNNISTSSNGSSILLSNGVLLYAYDGKLSTFTIPSGTRIIADGAFKGCNSLTSITIPNSVTRIGSNAFEGCTTLATINMGTGVKTIGRSAFSECNALANITFSSTLSEVGAYAFSGTKWLGTASPEGNIIYAGTVAYCLSSTTATSITVKDGTLGYSGSMRNYRGLSNGVYHDGLGELALKNVSLPTSIIYCEDEGLMTSNTLETFNLPANTKIGSVLAKQLDDNLYFGTLSVKSLSIDTNNPYYTVVNGVVFNKAKTVLLSASTSVTGDYTVPSSVNTIASNAFGKGLSSIMIPSSVSLICNTAITQIPRVYFMSKTKPTALSGSLTSSNLMFVQKGCLSEYTDANYWNTFSNIKENNFDMENAINIEIAVSSAKWSTLILPFNASIPSGLKVYSCDASSNNVLTFEEQSSIKANTPYIINGEEGTYTFSGKGSAWDDTYNGGWFTGAYVDTTVPENSYILAKVSGVLGFYKVIGDNVGKAKIAPYHCYLTPSGSAAKGINTFMFDDDSATGVNSIQNDSNNNQTIYDVMGRKLSGLHKGINIVNGKKIIVK